MTWDDHAACTVCTSAHHQNISANQQKSRSSCQEHFGVCEGTCCNRCNCACHPLRQAPHPTLLCHQHACVAVKAASVGVLKALLSRCMCCPPGSAPSFALLSGVASHSACRHAAAAATAAALLWLAAQLRSDCNSPATAASAASTSCCRQHNGRHGFSSSRSIARARVQQRSRSTAGAASTTDRASSCVMPHAGIDRYIDDDPIQLQ
jgi:hypothetical protein